MLSRKLRHSGNTKQRWSIRTLLSCLVLASLLPGMIGATALFVHQYRNGRTQLEQHTVQTARALVQAVDNKIFRLQALAQGLASVSTLAHGDLAAFHRQAQETLHHANLGQAVILVDRNGQQILNTLWEPGVPLPKTSIPETIQRVFETRKPVISPVFASTTIKQPVMTVAVPVFVNGQVKYVLTVPMLSAVFSEILRDQHLPPDWIASILDSSLTIIARTHQGEMFIGKKPRPEFIERLNSFNEEVYESTTLDGVLSLVAFARSHETLWGIGIAFPLESSQIPLVRHLGNLALGLAVLVALGVGMAWFIGDEIARSFRAIVAQAAALGAGETVSRPVVHVKEAEEATLAIGEAAELLSQRQADLMDSERRYKGLFNNKTMAIVHQRIVTNDKGQPVDYYIEAVNEPYEHLTGLKADEATGRLVTELFPDVREYGFDFIGEFGRIALEGGERNFEVYFPPLGRWLSFYAYSPKQGECTAIFTDVTAQKEAEAEIQRLNADLEKRVAQRTAELVAANQELEGFTFATSHDLKGPLGRINSFCTLLERTSRNRLEGDSLVFLDIIRQNASRLTLLVDDLLNHARIAQQTLQLQKIDISEAVQATIWEKTQESVELKGEIKANLPHSQVLADPHALSQALGNLVENAIKYSSQVPSPLIEIGGELTADRFRLWVRDNGIGFKMEYHDKIFQIFQRLHTYTEYTGSGVGLALVKRAVERMGGQVWAESEPGKGATFFVELQAVV